MKVTKKKQKPETKTFSDALTEISEKYENFFVVQYDDEYFIIRALGRKEYKQIEENVQLNDFEKEDLVCEAALLWPENYDFDNCLAGIPYKLYKDILEKSFLSTTEQLTFLIEYGREETEELGTQMNLIISEAFPAYTMDEIEDWDMFKFTKRFTQAEWKLKTLRDVTLTTDILEYLKKYEEAIHNEDNGNNIEERSIDVSQEETVPEPTKTVGKKKMTEEQMRAYREAQAKFPEIDWSKDASFEGFDTESNHTSFSTVAPALRPGWR